MDKIEIVGEETEAQINKWKSETGDNVFQITVIGEDKNYVGYVKKPGLDVLSAAARYVESDPVKSGLIMFDNVWLGGAEEIKVDEELKMSAIKKIGEIFKVREAEIKKL